MTCGLEGRPQAFSTGVKVGSKIRPMRREGCKGLAHIFPKHGSYNGSGNYYSWVEACARHCRAPKPTSQSQRQCTLSSGDWSRNGVPGRT